MSERIEALTRILVAIVSGIIIGIWGLINFFLVVVHLIYVLLMGKRDRGLANFSNKWLNASYDLVRYMSLATNKRPFPFTSLKRPRESTLLQFKGSERWEVIKRLLITWLSGVILDAFNSVNLIVAMVHWFYELIWGERIRTLSSLANRYAAFYYQFLRYLMFTTNERPFPFNAWKKPFDAIDV